MKNDYIKPTVQIVMLNHKTPLLTISRIDCAGMENEQENLFMSDELAGDGFFAR